MRDVKISAMTTAAYALWALALGLVVNGMLTSVRTGQLGLLAAGVAMVLNVRGFFCTFSHRERQAFDLGADSKSLRDLNSR